MSSAVLAQPKVIPCSTTDSMSSMTATDTSAIVVCGKQLYMCTSASKMRSLITSDKAYGYCAAKLDSTASALNLSIHVNQLLDSTMYYSRKSSGFSQQAYDTLRVSVAKSDTIIGKLRQIQGLDSTKLKICEDSKTPVLTQILFVLGAFAIGFISATLLLR